MAEDEIKDKIRELALINDFDLTENLDEIVKAKLRFFGEYDWFLCPCDRESDERFCCSIRCQKDVKETGMCHCNLFKRKEK